MRPQIIQDGEESLDDLLVMARKDASMLRLMKKVKTNHVYDKGFLGLAYSPRAEMLVRAVEEEYGCSSLEKWKVKVTNFAYLGLLAKLGLGEIDEEEANAWFDFIQDDNRVDSKLMEFIINCQLGCTDTATGSLFQFKQDVYYFLKKDSRNLIGDNAGTVTTLTNSLFALAHAGINDFEEAVSVLAGIDDYIGHDADSFLVLAARTGKYCLSSQANAAYYIASSFFGNRTEILRDIESEIGFSADKKWVNEEKDKEDKDVHSNMWMALAYMREAYLKNADKNNPGQ
jgi:hypothetical protein